LREGITNREPHGISCVNTSKPIPFRLKSSRLCENAISRKSAHVAATKQSGDFVDSPEVVGKGYSALCLILELSTIEGALHSLDI
jgi:hypothetical protein